MQMFVNLVQLLGPGAPSEKQLMQPAQDPGDLPWFAIRIGMALGRFVELLPNWVNPPTVQMLQLGALAHFKACTIKALAELGEMQKACAKPLIHLTNVCCLVVGRMLHRAMAWTSASYIITRKIFSPHAGQTHGHHQTQCLQLELTSVLHAA